MRTSQLLLATLRNAPTDAELISHQLMLRAGLIRKLSSGLYSWLPLGFKVLQKVSAIVREELDRSGAQEILMPHLQPAELWQETGRWDAFGPQLLKMNDRHQHAFCFGPTHEEVITDLMRHTLNTYKQLPCCFYQIQTKFRDEIRPRFGVMRAREFLMADAYSFHLDQSSLQKTYETLYQVYSSIFTRMGLSYRAVQADTGAIGGNASHEFHVLADAGEDLIAYSDCSDFAANLELCACLPEARPAPSSTPIPEKTRVTTPGIKGVSAQAEVLAIPTSRILKTILVRGRDPQKHPIIALLVRGDQNINPCKAEKHPLVATPFTLIDEETLTQLTQCAPGFVGPLGLSIPCLADYSVQTLEDFSCGANQTDHHYLHLCWGRDLPLPECTDLRFAQEGDPSPDGQGHLRFCRGIEVGHIFQLQDKYSQAMQVSVLTETGQPLTPLMGCYGIGVSRIVAACIEQHHDDKGIIWPLALAPFQVALVPLNPHRSEAVRLLSEQLYRTFQSHRIDVLLDDRDERPGVKFSDMELIGIPFRITIGEKSLAQGQVELQHRATGQQEYHTPETIVQRILELIGHPPCLH